MNAPENTNESIMRNLILMAEKIMTENGMEQNGARAKIIASQLLRILTYQRDKMIEISTTETEKALLAAFTSKSEVEELVSEIKTSMTKIHELALIQMNPNEVLK